MTITPFPATFTWGVATSAYQIEGAANADGKGPSIWDEFVRRPGAIADGGTGDVACDNYHRFRDDVSLMAGLGIKAYRFSISWPRIFPNGTGEVNTAGLDFYEKLVDLLLEKNIEPFATLYHWDLPLALHNRGGWENPAIAQWFADYAEQVAQRLKGRIRRWITINEPSIVYSLGYRSGVHAPGIRNSSRLSEIIHHLNLAHGQAYRRIKAVDGAALVGMAPCCWPLYPATPADLELANRWSGLDVKLFIDPLIKGSYPQTPWPDVQPAGLKHVSQDLANIKDTLDFIGVNHYSRSLIRAAATSEGFEHVVPAYSGLTRTDMGWEIFPAAMYATLVFLKREYGNIPVFITENGAACRDIVTKGKIEDGVRIQYLRDNILMVNRAMCDGCNVQGYFVWSLLDNFEWSHGYAKRFGLVYVDYATQQRTVKESGKWYSRLCRGEAGLI